MCIRDSCSTQNRSIVAGLLVSVALLHIRGGGSACGKTLMVLNNDTLSVPSGQSQLVGRKPSPRRPQCQQCPTSEMALSMARSRRKSMPLDADPHDRGAARSAAPPAPETEASSCRLPSTSELRRGPLGQVGHAGTAAPSDRVGGQPADF
eukprot:266215-Alexandrium_andersonii.AAC.1